MSYKQNQYTGLPDFYEGSSISVPVSIANGGTGNTSYTPDAMLWFDSTQISSADDTLYTYVSGSSTITHNGRILVNDIFTYFEQTGLAAYGIYGSGTESGLYEMTSGTSIAAYDIDTNYFMYGGGILQLNSVNGYFYTAMGVVNNVATLPVFSIYGAFGQTANLQEWREGGTTTKVLSVKKDGVIKFERSNTPTASGELAKTSAGLVYHDGTAVREVMNKVRKNSAGTIFSRPQLNLIEGSNITLTVADDAGNGEVDVTIAASGGGGGVSEAFVIAMAVAL